MRRALTPLRLGVAGALLLAVVVAALLTTTTDSFLLIPDRAHPLAQLVKVPGGKTRTGGGGIYYVDVLERKASVLERLIPALRRDSTLVEHEQVTPPGVTDRQRIAADRLDMQLSQQVASAVALRALGYDVKIESEGTRVALVYANSHAKGKLEPGDVIRSIDGKRVRTTLQLRHAIAGHEVGDLIRVGFRRGGKRMTVGVRAIRDQETSRPILGIAPQPALKLDVPFKIRFNLRNVGGPSAGLAFALQIMEARGRNVDHGYRVAATGVIDPDGTVSPIGGVKQKTIGARRAHVDVFLVPAGDNYREARKYAGGLRLIPVKTFQQALRALATLPRKR